MMERAAEIVDEVDGFATDQFRNEDMIDGYEELGTELAEQLDGRLDAYLRLRGHRRLLPGRHSRAAGTHSGAPARAGRAGASRR